MVKTLGESLADKLKESERYEGDSVQGDIISFSRIYRMIIRGTVSYSVETRDNSYTFLVGDDTKSKLDVTNVGKEEWTEVGSG